MNISASVQQQKISSDLEIRQDEFPGMPLTERNEKPVFGPWIGRQVGSRGGQPSWQHAAGQSTLQNSKDLTSGVAEELQIEINSASDIATARRLGRATAIESGFQGGEVILIVAVISEVARNIVDYATRGEIVIRHLQDDERSGIQIVARDMGPGIPDVARAMQYGCATRKGLGMGLPGIRWLVDEFAITSEVDRGTIVMMKKWIRKFEL